MVRKKLRKARKVIQTSYVMPSASHAVLVKGTIVRRSPEVFICGLKGDFCRRDHVVSLVKVHRTDKNLKLYSCDFSYFCCNGEAMLLKVVGNGKEKYSFHKKPRVVKTLKAN